MHFIYSEQSYKYFLKKIIFIKKINYNFDLNQKNSRIVYFLLEAYIVPAGYQSSQTKSNRILRYAGLNKILKNQKSDPSLSPESDFFIYQKEKTLFHGYIFINYLIFW